MARVRTSTRIITNKGQRRTLGLVPSPKAKGLLVSESLAEMDGLMNLIFDPSVVEVQVQPCVLTITRGDSSFNCIPDARYVRDDGRIGFKEFKSSREDVDEDTFARLELTGVQLQSQGYEFSTDFADELRGTKRLHNVNLLFRYRDWPCAQDLDAQVKELLGRGPATLARLRDFVGEGSYGSLYRMLWEQTLVFDMRQALGPRTLIAMP